MRLLLIEDNRKLALNTGASLRDNSFAVDIVHNGEDALLAVRSFDYDAIVLDLGLPDMDGFDLLKDIKRIRATTPVIICTARDALDDRLRGLNSGSDDYVIKPFAFSELLARIRAVLRRPGSALGMELSAGNLRFDTVDRSVTIEDRPVRFSGRELALLELFLRRAGRVQSKAAIENALYGFEEPPTPNAIEVLTHRLRKKLAGYGANATIHNLRGVGYLLEASRE